MDQATPSAASSCSEGLRFAPRIAVDGRCVGVEVVPGEGGPTGQSLLDGALRHAAAWRRQGRRIFVSVPLSVEGLGDPDLAVRVQLLLLKWLVPPLLLELRLPADLALARACNARTQLRRLLAAGIGLAAEHRLGDPVAALQRLRIGALRLDFPGPETVGVSRDVLREALLALRDELGWSLVAAAHHEGWADLVALCDEATAPSLDAAAFQAWLDSPGPAGTKKAAA